MAGYDAQGAGTSPSRATQDEGGEQFGVRIGNTDVPALSADLPDSVAEGAVDQHYSGIHTTTLAAWAGVTVTGGMIIGPSRIAV